MFCCNCGKKLPDSAKFCWSCGTPTIGEQGCEEHSIPKAHPEPTLTSMPEQHPSLSKPCYEPQYSPQFEPQRSRQFESQPMPHPEQHRCAEKPKKSGGKWFVAIFIAIIVVIGGVIAYLWFEDGGVTNIYGTPRKTVDRMLSSWAKGEYIETRSCLHPDMASDFDYDDFDDLEVYSYSIERVEQSGSSATVWVDISTNDGWYEDQEVSLIRDGNRWRVTDL